MRRKISEAFLSLRVVRFTVPLPQNGGSLQQQRKYPFTRTPRTSVNEAAEGRRTPSRCPYTIWCTPLRLVHRLVQRPNSQCRSLDNSHRDREPKLSKSEASKGLVAQRISVRTLWSSGIWGGRGRQASCVRHTASSCVDRHCWIRFTLAWLSLRPKQGSSPNNIFFSSFSLLWCLPGPAPPVLRGVSRKSPHSCRFSCVSCLLAFLSQPLCLCCFLSLYLPKVSFRHLACFSIDLGNIRFLLDSR